MKKVCLLIGEGDSERYFLPRLLERRSFESKLLKDGNSSIYSKDEVFWFFPFPPQLGSKVAGKERLKKPDTYQIASLFIKNHTYLFGNDFELYLVVLFDIDQSQSGVRKKLIEEAVASSSVSFKEVLICPVEVEIESWYFAGLESNFPDFKDQHDSELNRLLSSTTSSCHCKEKFNSFVDLNKTVGAKDISQSVGSHFNEEKAIRHSSTYKDFVALIKRYGLYY